MILASGELRTHRIQAINPASQACHGQKEQLEQGKADHLVPHKEKQFTPSIKAELPVAIRACDLLPGLGDSLTALGLGKGFQPPLRVSTSMCNYCY